MKKHNNSGKSEPTSKRAKPQGPMRRDTKEVLAELVGKLKEKLDPKKVAATSAGDPPRSQSRSAVGRPLRPERGGGGMAIPASSTLAAPSPCPVSQIRTAHSAFWSLRKRLPIRHQSPGWAPLRYGYLSGFLSGMGRSTQNATARIHGSHQSHVPRRSTQSVRGSLRSRVLSE